jgi:hypothetical protein
VNLIIITSLIFQLAAGSLPLAVLFVGKRKLNLEFLLFLSISFSLTLAIIITKISGFSNAIIFDSWLVCSIILLTIFYSRVIVFKPFTIAVIIIGGISLSTTFWELMVFGYPNKALIIENISFILIPILMYISFLRYQNHSKGNSLILINTSIFVYKTTTFLLFYFLVTLMKNNAWYIHNFIEGSSKLLIAYALWKLPKTAH